MSDSPRKFTVPPEAAGQRLDRFVSSQNPDLSRTRVQELIHAALVLLNGKPTKDAQKVHANDLIEVIPTPRPPLHAEAEEIPLEILYEDDDLLAVNKPAGMTVHAGAGNSHGTLVNALLGRGQSLSHGGSEIEDHLR